MLTCPFCREIDFDAIGLKNHFVQGHCAVYNETPAPPHPVSIDAVDKCFAQLAVFHGLPPYDELTNHARGDGYYYKGIERDFPPRIVAVAEARIRQAKEQWEAAKKAIFKDPIA
jgi:hypothetical protein